MASQPLNQTIKVFQRIRSQREPERHDSIKNIIGHLRRLILIAPGQEIRTVVGSRDTAVTDFSAYMGEARGVDAAGAPFRGLPVTIGVKQVKDFSVVSQLTGIDFPVEIGADKFIQETAAAVGSSDIYKTARDTTGGDTDRL